MTNLKRPLNSGKIRVKLVELLQSDLNYDAPKALERIEQRKELLLAELVILYGRVYAIFASSDGIVVAT